MSTLEQIADDLWQLRDVVSETDDCTAAQIHSIVNRIIVAGPDAA